MFSHQGVFSASVGYHEHIGGYDEYIRGRSAHQGYHEYIGGYHEYIGDVHEYIGDVQYIMVFNRNYQLAPPHASWYPPDGTEHCACCMQ